MEVLFTVYNVLLYEIFAHFYYYILLCLLQNKPEGKSWSPITVTAKHERHKGFKSQRQ